MQSDPDSAAVDSLDLASLRATLPDDAFRPEPLRLAWLFLHVAIASGCVWTASHVSLFLWPIPILIGSHSLLCLGLLTHDLSHGSLLRKSRLRGALEHWFWSLNLVSATVWKRTHNETHHRHYATDRDPDRQYLETERNRFSEWYTRLLYPHRETIPGNPLVFVQFIGYIARTIAAAFVPRSRNLGFLPAPPNYGWGDRFRILIDLVLMTGNFVAWYFLADLSPARFGAFLLATYFTTSAFSMMYIFTNHHLNEITEKVDPLGGCTSVAVPRWMDRMHSHFSYHTEHHLFPTLRPRYFPHVSRWLEEHHPDRYQRIPLHEAWLKLWKVPAFAPDPVPPGSGKSRKAHVS